MENNKKIGLTPLNWILSIIGIIFFLLLIALPPLFRVFIVDDIPGDGSTVLEPEPSDEPEDSSKTYVCVKNELISEEYRIILENESVKMIAYTNTSTYVEEDPNTTCDSITSSFVGADGLYNNCETTETERIITYRLDLDVYSEETSPFTFDYRLSNQEIIDNLTLNGFSCQESEQ